MVPGLNPSFRITCIDLAGNAAIVYLNFTVDTGLLPDIIQAPVSITAFKATITPFTIALLNTGQKIAGISADRLTIALNGTPVKFDIFDFGTGLYNISFIAPAVISWLL